MRLAIVTHSYPPFLARSGGVGTYSSNLAHFLAKEGVNVTVFCGKASELTIEKNVANLTVIRLPFLFDFVPPNFLWFQLQNFRFLAKSLSDFDLIHSQTPYGTICAYIKKKYGLPWVTTFHSINRREVQSLFKTQFSQWSFRDFVTDILGMPILDFLYKKEIANADHSIFAARTNLSDCRLIYKIDPTKCSFVPNGVNLDMINRIVRSNNVKVNVRCPTIFCASRLYARKGLELLVRAMPLIVKDHSNVKLKIFGEGPLKPRIKKLIDAFHLHDNVMLLGQIRWEKLMVELHQSDLAVFPSFYENQCTSILEAMACHKAVVAFRFPFNEEIISHMKTGCLVSPFDINGLASEISWLLSNPRTSFNIGEAAYKYIQENHDWKNLAKEYLTIYDSLL